MNDERRLSAAGGGQALVDTDDLARVAVPAQRTGHRAAGDPQALSHSDKRLIAVSMMLPVFLGSVDQSVLASALPTIGRDLGEVHNLPWLITAFLIASTALTPLCGKFADIYGRRAPNLGGIRYPWLSLPIIALFVCAMVLGAGFVLRLRTAIEPLIPIAILADIALQNTVPVHDLGAALGSMNFVRTLVATIMIAIFGAIILANAPVGARGGTLSQSFLGSASMATFSVVFLAIAVTLAASFLSLFLLEEKPLAEA